MRFFNVLVLLLISLSYSFSQSLEDNNTIEKIISDSTPIEEKLLICEKGLSIDKKETADILTEYLKKSDKRLLEKLASIIISSDFCHNNISHLNKIKDCLENRLPELKNDADATYRIFEVLELIQSRTALDSNDSKVRNSSELFLKCFSHLDQQNKNQFVDRSINGGIFLPLFFAFEEKYSFLLSECLASGSSSSHNTILQFLLDNYFLVGKPELVSEVLKLTSSKDKILENKARTLAYKLFPFACSEAEKDTFDWGIWWDKNAKQFPFTNQSQEVLSDKKASDAVRLSVLSKLRDIEPATINTLLKISMDHSDSLNVRSGCLALLISYVHQSKQKKQVSEDLFNINKILDAINGIIKSSVSEGKNLLLSNILNMLVSVDLADHKLNETLRDLMLNPKIDGMIKAKICAVLANSKLNRKMNAEKCLTYYQGSKDMPPQVKEQVLYALTILTGQKDAFNKKSGKFIETLDFWRKAVSEMPDDPPEEGNNAGAGKE